jgi:hypothetical protein
VSVPAKKKSKRPLKKRTAKKRPARKRAATTRTGNDKAVREHVLHLLESGHAHADLDRVLAGLPEEQRGQKPQGLPFTPWRLLEHMRIAQWDILGFCRSAKHVSPEWSAGYWPRGDAPEDSEGWEKSIKAFRSDLKAMRELIADPRTDLLARIPHGDGQTILKEGLLVADHNAYHLGQLVLVRRLLGSWSD